MPQTSAMAYIREGATPFFRLPVVDVHAAAPYAGLDAVVIGVPWDMSVTYRPGARFAPYEIRRVSALVQSFHPVHKVDVLSVLRAADGGNVAVPPFAPQLARDLIENEVASIVTAGAVPFAVGGDHSIALPALRAVAKKHGPLAIVHFDAHLDTSDAAVWGDAFHHGAPLRHAIEEGLVERGQLHQIAIRAPWGYAEEGALAADHGAVLYDVDAVASRGPADVARSIAAAIGDRPAYVTFDVDGVDPAFAPGTGTPVPGGISSREAIALLREASPACGWSAWTSSRSARAWITRTSRATSPRTSSTRDWRSPPCASLVEPVGAAADERVRHVRATYAWLLRYESGTLLRLVVSWLPSPWHQYPDSAGMADAWARVAKRVGAVTQVIGTSVEGRAIHSYELGNPNGEPVLLTG